MLKKVLLTTAVLIILLVAAGVAFIGPSNIIGMIRYDQRRQGDLQVGNKAPDVSLVALDGRSERRLSEFIGARPLVLIFGSFT